MLTGWWRPFKVDRPLTSEERLAALPRKPQAGIVPDNWGGVIHCNSTYVDFIDRAFRLRGMVNTTALVLGIILLTCGGIWSIFFVEYPLYHKGKDNLITFLISSVAFAFVTFGGAALLYYSGPKRDLFTYTHYPIRFNRKTRKVHVFRHNGPGGVLTVPWDEVFFHIGRGRFEKFLCDVRGHVLDGQRVKDTFAVGHYYDDSRINQIREEWEFIRRYMEDGPEAVAPHPLDRLVELSVKPTWTNAYIWVVASLGEGLLAMRYVLAPVVYPIYGLLTLVRYLTLKSCKEPVWPPEVLAESAIEPDDPNQWEEPEFINAFTNRPEVLKHLQARQNKGV